MLKEMGFHLPHRSAAIAHYTSYLRYAKLLPGLRISSLDLDVLEAPKQNAKKMALHREV